VETSGQGGEQGDSRRERKKVAVRRAIVDAAIKLFAERGFEATTVEDISDAADVSPRTFHRDFPSKQDVVFGDNEPRLEILRSALAARSVDEPVFVGIRNAVAAVVATVAPRRDLELTRARLVASSKTLREHNLRYLDDWAHVVAEHVAAREGCLPSEAWPVLVGRCTLAVLSTSLMQWIAADGEDLGEVTSGVFGLLDDLAAGAP
jgi:AcrR family transcriptional regulator